MSGLGQKSRRGIAAAVGAVLAVVLAAGGAYWAWRHWDERTNPADAGAGKAADGGSDDRRVWRAIVEKFGVIEPKASVERSVTIQNDSRQAWQLADVASDCGCVVHRFEPQRIEPGQSGRLTVSYTAPDTEGQVSRNVRIKFADADAPLFAVNLRGVVRRAVSVNPNVIVLGQIVPGQPVSFPVDVLNRGGHAIDWPTAKSSYDWVQAIPAPAASVRDEADGQPAELTRVELRFTAPEQSESPFVDGELTIPVDGGHTPALAVKFLGRIAQPLSAVPERLFFGYVPPEGERTAELRIRADGELARAALRLETPEELAGMLDVRLERAEGEREGEYVLTAALHPQGLGLIRGAIRVAAGEAAHLDIPVAAFVKE